MSVLAERAAEYLEIRRALGHHLAEAHRLLPRFVAYLDAAGAETVTVELALAWATAPPEGAPPSTVWGRRMTVARAFARHLSALDPRTGSRRRAYSLPGTGTGPCPTCTPRPRWPPSWPQPAGCLPRCGPPPSRH